MPKRYNDQEYVVEIRPGDPAAHVAKVLEVGYVKFITQLNTSSFVQVKRLMSMDMGCINADSLVMRKNFLYITKRRVVACVSAERIQEAFKLIPSVRTEKLSKVENLFEFEKDETEAVSQCSTSVKCSSIPIPCVIGIAYIWVDKRHRRRNLASRLVDIARTSLIFGFKAERNECAFSQPTHMGQQFAQKFAGTNEILVY